MADTGERIQLQDVSETALWVATYRAHESRREDALFDDPFAARLAGERGEQLLDSMPSGRRLAWPMVLRTVLFDGMIQERVAAGTDLVVNLAAGLDTRPYRMPLPADLTWVEVDLPRMIEYKSSILEAERPVCKVERVALDLADGVARRALLERLGTRGRRALVLTEGLLIYLQPEEVESLAGDLAAQSCFEAWVTDLASPGLLKMMRRTWGKEVEQAGAPFRFAPAEGPEFFNRFGWRPVRVEEPFYHAARAGRLPWFLRLLARLPKPKRFNPRRVWSGTCLLERLDPPADGAS